MSDLAIRPQELGIGRLFETVHDAVIVANAQTGRIVLWNPSATEVFGYSLREALEMNVEALVPKPLKERHRAGISRYLDTGHGSYIDSRAALELPAVRKGGEQIYVELTLSPVEPVHESETMDRFVLAIVRDVTERKEVEKRSRQAETRYRTLVEQVPVVIYTQEIEHDNAISYISPRIEEVTGYSPQEYMDDPDLWIKTTHPEDRERVLAEDRRTDETGESFGIEYRQITCDGRVVWIRDEASLVHDQEGQPRYWQGIMLDITERKRAEEALKESEERYRLVARATNEAIWDSDMLADRQTWDGAVEAMFGYPVRQETDSAWWEERIHPEDRERVLAGIEEVLQNGGEMWSEEYRFRRSDGAYATVVDRAYVARDAEGEPIRTIGSMMDVTGRKRAEKEIRRLNEELEGRVERRTAQLEAAISELREHGRRLRESEERYRLVVESSNEGIFDWNVRTGEVFWNERFFEILGLSSDEVIPSIELFVGSLHPEDQQRVMDSITAHLEHSSVYDVEYRARHSSGSYRFCHARGATQRDESGRASRMTGVVQDVTERKWAEEALKESEARFRTLVEQIPAITYIEAVDSDERSTNLLYASPQIEDMFGYTPEEWMGDPELFPRLLHPDDRERVLAEDERTEITGEPFRTEYRQYTKDGRVIWVRDEATLVHDYEGRALFWQGVMFDITEHKRYEEKLAALVEELRRSNVELEQFAYVASHDLQEPLRMVASYTQLLARRYEGKLDEDADEFIGYAVDGANRMQSLINDLLTYSRVGTRGKELEPIDTQAAFEAACANLRTAIEEAGAKVVCAVELPRVMGDGIQLVQLFQNLIANAIKFCREGEVPRVEVGAEWREEEGEWLFWVADNGIGMDARYAERIFRIFQRLHGKGEYSGTGIGLAVCKKIVERHGGRIWAESEEGGGSTFYFTLRP